MSIGVWQHQGTVISTISGHHLECSTVLYEANPVILSANPDGKIFKIWGSTVAGPCYAESPDGITWTAYSGNPLIAGISTVHESKVYKQGNTYYLFDGPIPGGPIAVYTSTDGVTFSLRNASAIPQGTAGNPDAAWAGQLAVVDIINGTWYAYYAGQATGSGGYVMIQATSTDGINWTKNYGNQITQYGPSNFNFYKVNGAYYGWSQVVIPNIPASGTLGLPSDITRFSSSNPSGPWTILSNYPTFYRTLTTEGVGSTTGQVADPNLVQGPSGGLYIFFTQKSQGQLGNNGVIGCAIAPSTTLSQLIDTYEGVQNVPIPWGSSGTPIQLNLLASDNFQRANANPIGGNWSPFHAGSGFGTAQLLSNVATSSTAGVNSDSFWNALVWPADQWSQITVGACAATSFAGLNLRDNTSGVLTAYRLYWTGSTGSSGTFQPQRVVAGAFSNLTNATTGILNIGDVLTAAVVGSTISFYQNGNLLLVNTDSNVASGAAGFFITPTTAVMNANATAWSGGNFSYSIGGNCGIGGATISYTGPSSGSVIADSVGTYAIFGLANGTYTITPSKTGSAFLPLSQSVTISGSNVTGVNFSAGVFVYSVPDCRVPTAITPNSSRTVNATKIYDVPKVDSRAAGAPVDSRVAPNIPVASGTYPQNSRTPGTFGPGE